MLENQHSAVVADHSVRTLDDIGNFMRIVIDNVANQMCRPSTIYRPKLSRDGNQWCALYGDNLQDGIAGFGDTVADAMTDFDKNWNTYKFKS